MKENGKHIHTRKKEKSEEYIFFVKPKIHES